MSLPPLRVLCFDGGLANTITSLMILKEVLHRVAFKQGSFRPVLAYRFFDVIAGSGTGGLVAILLGRLQMPIDEVISFFDDFCKKGLSDSQLNFSRTNDIEKISKNLVLKKTNKNDASIINPSGCRTIAFTMSRENIDAALPTLLRTYLPAKSPEVNCTVWEAIRAATATPGIFDPIEIETSPPFTESFIDASTGCHNPIRLVLRELSSEFPSRPIGLLLSLGAGRKAVIEATRTPLGEVYKNISRDCEATAEEFDSSEDRQKLGEAYIRLNVEQGMQVLDASYKRAAKQMLAHARIYLQSHSTDRKVMRMVERVLDEGDSEFELL